MLNLCTLPLLLICPLLERPCCTGMGLLALTGWPLPAPGGRPIWFWGFKGMRLPRLLLRAGSWLPAAFVPAAGGVACWAAGFSEDLLPKR